MSVLCPGAVKTQLMDGSATAGLRCEIQPGRLASAPQSAVMEQAFRQLVAAGTEPAGIADRVLTAIKDEQFYILPHPGWKEQVRTRMGDIIAERNPPVEVAL